MAGQPQRPGERQADQAQCPVARDHPPQRLSEIEPEVGALGDDRVELGRVTAALAEFDALWDVLEPRERERLIHAVIERVECSPDNELRVIFRTQINQPLSV